MSFIDFLPDQEVLLNGSSFGNDFFNVNNTFTDASFYNNFEHGSTGSPEADDMSIITDSTLIPNPLNDCELIANLSQFNPNDIQLIDDNTPQTNEANQEGCLPEVPLIPDLEETIMNSYNSFWTNSNALSSFTSMQTDNSTSSGFNSQLFDNLSSPLSHAGCSSSPIASPPDSGSFDPLSSPPDEDVKKPSRKRARTSKSSKDSKESSSSSSSSAKDPNSTFFTIPREQLLTMSITEYESLVSSKRLERQSSPSSPSASSSLSASLSSSNTTEAEEKDIRRQRRLIKNRESAQFSREKRKNKMQTLESTVSCLTLENNSLKSQVSSLQQKVLKLKSKLQKYAPPSNNPIKKEKIKNHNGQNLKHVAQVFFALAGFGMLYCYLVQGGAGIRAGNIKGISETIRKGGGAVLENGVGTWGANAKNKFIGRYLLNTTEDTTEEAIGIGGLGLGGGNVEIWNGTQLMNTTEVEMKQEEGEEEHFTLGMEGMLKKVKMEVEEETEVERRGQKRTREGEVKDEKEWGGIGC
eukprot:TRINITY_DN612_c0_g1_i1.p1 TRINITY_DN612_c0_g1~~TRINITY_DN612_c0_g1_i1.p1  ORF type:complete len:524 (-),score=172.65 TRINITY_DN612_c0_g1_i1:79-1650(-)